MVKKTFAERILDGAPAKRTGDQIVYKVMIYTSKGADCDCACFERDDIGNIDSDLCEVFPVVVNMEDARMTALAKLDGLDRLVLGLDE